MFTPRRMTALEPQIRELCAEALDPHVGTGELDFITHLGKFMPMRVIGMLLGIPEEDQAAIRDRADANIRVRAGEKMHVGETQLDIGIEMFTEYIDWRAEHPSDDLMTALLTAEFEDENGETRRLTREEVLTYVTVVAGAGNETTTRLIGWAGKVLADFPDERRKLVEDPSLIPNAIEELLRFEPPAPHAARYVTKDVEYYGRTVPEGERDAAVDGLGQPRRAQVREPRPVRRQPRGARPHRVRVRPALLPWRRSGPPRGPHRARRGPQAIPGVDRRHESGPSCRPRPRSVAGRPSP